MSRVLSRGILAIGLALLGAACGDADLPGAALSARLAADRTEARVGDRVALTVEIETPREFAIEPPVAPKADVFFTESLELLEPIEIGNGLRHHLLWTVRPREVGEAALPTLEIPVVRPDGRIQRLRVGGMPLPVLSVTEDLPERELYFDIRDAPPVRRDRTLLYGGVTLLGLLAALTGVAVWRRRRHLEEQGPPPSELAAEALARIEAALPEADSRALARRVREPIGEYIARRFKIELAGLLPAELPEPVNPALVDALGALDRSRFAREPQRAAVLEAAGGAMGHLKDVARVRR